MMFFMLNIVLSGWMLKYFFKTIAVVLKHENTYKDTNSEANQISEKSKEDLEQIKK